MFQIMWVVGFIISGSPHIEYMPDADEPMELAYCHGFIAEREARMADYIRGRMRAPLDFPIAVAGECRPVHRPT